MDVEKVSKRILGLLALAGANPTEPEQVSAAALAEKIADRYGVDLEALRQSATKKTERPDVGREWVDLDSRALWLANLAWGIAPFAGVEVVRCGKRLAVIGTETDRRTWRAMFERARDEIATEATRYVGNLPDYLGRGEKRSAGDAFRKGAGDGFASRLRKHRAEAEASAAGQVTASALADAGRTTSTGIVLVSRAIAVEQKKKEFFPKLRTMRVEARSAIGYSEGRRFGSNMGVHRGNLKG